MMTIEHPYTELEGGEWLSGNLHAHTTASDGERSLQQVIDAYASYGHGFLMISDHDVYTSPAEYGGVDNRGLILLPGNEITAGGPHLLHVGARSLVEAFEERQKVVDTVSAEGGFAVFNHPNWFSRFNHCPQEALESCHGYAGIEIYNGVISRLEGSPYATDRWDMLLSKGRRVWGYANDDSHRSSGDDRLGWNVVYVTDPTPAGVIEALATGRFYASTGVIINDISVEGRKIALQTANAQKIVALKDNAVRFAESDGAALSVEVPDGASYVRFECWGQGESFAWSQPFFVSQ